MQKEKGARTPPFYIKTIELTITGDGDVSAFSWSKGR